MIQAISITCLQLCFRVECEGPKSLAVAVSLLAPEVQVLDMPVDPNEPTYCLCHQVSDAEINTAMIQLSAFLLIGSQ